MNLKPKAAAAWLAAPLLAMMVIACGDDGTTSNEPDGGTSDTSTGTGECGDGVMDEGEECDDGNTRDGDSCSATCTIPEPAAECGNSEVDDGEECDTGNRNGVPGTDCTELCLNDVRGDGHRGSTEDCDDGNLVDGDGCEADGTVTPPPERCGDGEVQDGEQCDEGNANGTVGAGCTSACLDNRCGDGFIGGEEVCDDGNRVNDDDCTNECAAPITTSCGDGNVDEGEECDEGSDNGDRDSACTANCRDAECGDGTINNGEACDEGAENGLDGVRCAIDCTVDVCGNGQQGPSEACDDGDDTDPADGCHECVSATCGDGEVQDGEECDSGDSNGEPGDTCAADCDLNVCGDSFVGEGEECDLGRGNGGNGAPGVTCTTECMNNVCGDGFVGPGEACDDGAENNPQGPCTEECVGTRCGDGVVQDDEVCDLGDNNSDTGAECTTACLEPTCGDGFVQPGEECDDGVQNSDTVEGACRTTCEAASCGDSVIDANLGEECDLGAQNGIGGVCSSNCNNTSCGDGVIQDDEECDDGNTNNNDSCLTTCVWNECGDGAVYTAETDPLNPNDVEECDDANDANSDSCLNTCEYNVCADTFTLTTITEPYGDPDANGIMTASRAALATGEDTVAEGVCVDDSCANAVFHHTGQGIRDASYEGQVDEDGDDCNSESDECYPEPLAAFFISQVDVEQCDDGNATNTDACVAANFDSDGALECRTAVCGDGLVLAGTEDCDEALGSAARGNNNDSCLDSCEFNSCGDGWLYTDETDTNNPANVEACDDGNTVNTDLCSPTCTVAGVTTNTGLSATCGDGVVQPGEGCDNGAARSDAPGSVCRLNCRIPTCGNGTVDAGEQCDDGNLDNNDQCVNTCRWNVCGDGFRYILTTAHVNNNQPLEECDDANSNNNDECTTSCLWAECGDTNVFTHTSGDDDEHTGLNGPSWAVGGPANPGNAVTHSCEEDVLPPAEPYYECDNPNFGDSFEECDGTDISGQVTPAGTCTAACTLTTCGNGIVDGDEDCDGGPGCEADCSFSPVCGDGRLQWGEGCDGDVMIAAAPGDGATPNTTALPSGVTCLADCRVSTCRGTAGVQAGEQCDDGNSVSSDSCTNSCLVSRCGDGIVQPTLDEECDDGNDVETDSCTNNCAFNVLGDGVRYTAQTIDSHDEDLHECDTGEIEAAVEHETDLGTPGGRAPWRAERVTEDCNDPETGSCDGDGFQDETDFCGAWDDPTVANRGRIMCAPAATGRGVTPWKNSTYCLMPAEAHGDHSTNDAPELLRHNWYDAKAHCESYGIDARLVVVDTVANRTALATAADAAGVAGVANGAQVGYCEGITDGGADCDVDGDCDSGDCASYRCVGGEDAGDLCETDEDCTGGACLGQCTSDNGAVCDDDDECDGIGVCAARMSWLGLYDDFTGDVNGENPVSTNPGRWYWLGNAGAEDTLDSSANQALWKHIAGPPTDFSQYPSSGGDCGALDQGTDGTVTVATEGWDDEACARTYAYMCEFPL